MGLIIKYFFPLLLINSPFLNKSSWSHMICYVFDAVVTLIYRVVAQHRQQHNNLNNPTFYSILFCILDSLYSTSEAWLVDLWEQKMKASSQWCQDELWPLDWVSVYECVWERKDIKRDWYTHKVKGIRGWRESEKRMKEISLLTSGWPLCGWPWWSPWW